MRKIYTHTKTANFQKQFSRILREKQVNQNQNCGEVYVKEKINRNFNNKQSEVTAIYRIYFYVNIFTFILSFLIIF